MKKLILCLSILALLLGTTNAQLKAKPDCGPFYVDVLNGMVDNVKPDFSIDQIRAKYPCFTSEEQSGSKCGATLFYKEKDIIFFTERQYIEIGPNFKGKLSIPIMGASRGSLFKWLGNPKIKDANWDAFQTQYGTLVLHYNTAGKVRLIQFSDKGTEDLSLCE